MDLGEKERGEDSKVIIIAGVPKKHQNVRKPGCEISSLTRIHNIVHRVPCLNVIEIEYIFLQLPM